VADWRQSGQQGRWNGVYQPTMRISRTACSEAGGLPGAYGEMRGTDGK